MDQYINEYLKLKLLSKSKKNAIIDKYSDDVKDIQFDRNENSIDIYIRSIPKNEKVSEDSIDLTNKTSDKE